GFLLSVGACTGIALLSAPITRALPGPRPLASAAGATIAAQAGVAPVLVPVFGGLPVAALPANLLALPAAGPLTMWGIVAGLPAGIVGGSLATILHVPTAIMVGWVAAVARYSARVPLGDLHMSHVVALAVVVTVGASARAHQSTTWVRLTVIAGALVLLGAAVPQLRPPGANGTEIATGARLWRQGSATVLVVDGTASPARLLSAMHTHGVHRIDALIVLRPGAAAARAVTPLMARFPPRFILAPEGGRLRGAVVPEMGAEYAVGPLVVQVGAMKPRLEVQVGARRPATVAAGPPRSRSPPTTFSPVRLSLGTRSYDLTTRSLVMGILNRTPDSFFDAGSHFGLNAFCRRAEQLVTEGADILDIGGVKAGPGPDVDLQEELDRVIPAVETARARFDVPLSVDTWRAAVAAAAYGAGAVLGNDISGFADPDYLPVSAAAGATVVATHIRLGPRVPDPEPHYDDVVEEVRSFLAGRARRAEEAGISADRIVLDAGLDLGKTAGQSLTLLRHSRRLAELGYPLLLSASNKTFLGRILDLEITERREASLAATALGVAGGCRIVRTHDVQGTRRVCDTMAAILEAA
ncbi:MAG TPA: dihydropteroate synthase, partial [Acidimicrobiales bacterium]